MASARAEEYADGNKEFAKWLDQVNVIITKQIEIGLFDLEDMLTRDAFDDEVEPIEFVRETVAPMLETEYGPDFSDLLLEGLDE